MIDDDYFGKFEDVKYVKDAKLSVDVIVKILWVDDDLIYETSFSEAIKKDYGIEIIYCKQDQAVDEIETECYSLVVLDNDAYKGIAQGPQTLSDIRDIDDKIPIIYTSGSPQDVRSFVKSQVQEIVKTKEITFKLKDLVEMYVEEYKR